jgi:N-acetylneuraminate synthase
MSSNETIMIGERPVGRQHAPFIIAEMSGNHNHSLQRALQLVEAAAAAGAHALKLQTMTLDVDQDSFRINDPGSLWHGESLYHLYQKAHTPWDWHGPIFQRANQLGMMAFSTPFDDSAVDFLDQLGVPCFKIASFENTDVPLIRRVAATGKPLIISTGMASISELETSVSAARSAGCKELVLLKCTSTYPADPVNTNITTIPHMRELFDCQVGLSDHTMGVGVSVASVALGATVIEKHFTLARADGGVDSAFSLEPAELQQLVVETGRAWQSLGRVTYGPTAVEQKSLQFRRSLYVVGDIRKGQPLTSNNVRAIRPGFGLAPRYLDQALRSVAATDLARGTALQWKHLSPIQ